MNENEIGAILVDTALFLHRKLGPGLFESVYEVILAKLISKKGLYVQRQLAIPIRFEDESFDEAFRVDLFIQGKVIVELKSIDKVSDVHKKQLLTYLKLANVKLGYIINFGADLLKDGIIRVINGTVE
ncbi:MAG: GxxExxY protein [Treponema sp.]|nr:GxxExxY protein [Treponema sp.]